MSRRIDLSLFQGDSDGEDDLALPKLPVELNDRKAKVFSYGVTKKTKWDLEKEAEERKSKEEEEATKRALQEFSEEFSTPNARASGGGWGGNTRNFLRAGEQSVYNPRTGYQQHQQFAPRATHVASPRSPSPPPVPKRKGKRAMDSFLEEIKSNQQARDRKGPHDISATGGETSGRVLDHGMTNLFVVNLPASVSKDSLGRLFASVGPVATVKIMWPRRDEESSRSRSSLSGFVSFMNRTDAEKALRTFDDYDWNGTTLRVSWSAKPVPIPVQPAYESTAATARPAKKLRTEVEDEQDPQIAMAWFEKVSPDRARFIQTVADRIKTHGEEFREMLMEREVDNPQLTFLFDKETPDYHIFQYCTDSSYVFPEPPRAPFEEDGYASVNSTDTDEETERAATKNAFGSLGSIARRRFEAMLRSMSGKRVEIARAMEFALKRADTAEEIASLICESVQVDDTPVPRKMARLYLISDILHNSASPLPNVWKYRQAFERQLPAIVSHFADVHDRLLAYRGTITADIFRQQVEAVLTIWERWIVFTADVHEILQKLLHREATLESFLSGEYKKVETEAVPEEQPVFKSAGFKSSFKRVADTTTVPDHPPQDIAVGDEKEPSSDAVGDATVTLDIDGDPVEDTADVDGEAFDDIDGEAIDDIDGEAM